MNYRRGESARTRFRSERYFRSDDFWYFHTREGIAIGPYRSRFEAEIDAGMLLALLREVPPERAPTVIRDFVMGTGGELDYVNDPAFTSYLTQEGSGALTRTGT